MVAPPVTKKATPSKAKETEIPKQPEVVKKPTEQPVPTESENQVASINTTEIPPIPLERRLIGLAIVAHPNEHKSEGQSVPYRQGKILGRER